ncbi:DinB family protein [Planococcus lenghuensis]|uniref:DinB-like domain-containing protein n=1 Tax=Planococcus lenghuensis TaxID=2213202 RepID=A0A1Q2KZK6_9BACL|nr:DinB family protein [Planococcus lenghuensis]AQQ53072.1 hypothetical protein B0X71_08180 [Planococcus lenghuensis]
MHRKKNAEIREKLFQLLEGYSNDEVNIKPSAGEWSPVQILEHLYLMELTIIKGIEQELQNPESSTAKPKPIALTVNRFIKVEAPGRTKPSDIYQTIPQIKDKLNQSRASLDALYNAADKEELKRKSMRHPVFGLVPLDQWFSFVGLHEKRHAKQLKQTLKKIK